MSSSDENVLRFIAASFPSVWALELLLVLKSEPRVWEQEELVATLRASGSSSAKRSMPGRSRPRFDRDKGAAYLPVNRDVEGRVEQVEELYRTRPNSVRRVIVSAATRTANASPTHSSFEGTQVTEIFPTIVYVLCFLTSAACAWLLGRSDAGRHAPAAVEQHLLRALAANNLVLVLDLVVCPMAPTSGYFGSPSRWRRSCR